MIATPYEMMGGDDVARKLARKFYEVMATESPALLRLHQLGPDGLVSERTQERFERFLVEWLGGPKEFSPHFGHPRLRMRHGHVSVNIEMRDAWVRCMSLAMDQVGVVGDVRSFLESRFLEVADFLRNTEG